MNEELHTSEAGLALIKSSESLALVAYPDPGSGAEPFTCGWGHTLGVTIDTTCDEAQAEAWLLADVAPCEAAIVDNVTVQLTQNQYDATIDWIFNLGEENFKSSTFLKKLNTGDFDGAANEMLKWDKADGHVLRGLVNRRQAEAQMFNSGETT